MIADIKRQLENINSALKAISSKLDNLMTNSMSAMSPRNTLSNYSIQANDTKDNNDSSLACSLLNWCKQATKDHHIFYLLDKNNNCYYYISPTTSYQYTYSDKFILYKMEAIEGKICIVLYTDDNYEIFLPCKNRFGKNKYDEINKSIRTMIDSGNFVHCEF